MRVKPNKHGWTAYDRRRRVLAIMYRGVLTYHTGVRPRVARMMERQFDSMESHQLWQLVEAWRNCRLNLDAYGDGHEVQRVRYYKPEQDIDYGLGF